MLEGCRDGADIFDLRSAHHIDEIAAGLHVEFPWISEATTHVWRSLHHNLKAGMPGARFAPILLDGPHGIGKSAWARRLAQLLGTPDMIVDATGENASFGLVGSQRGWSNVRVLEGLFYSSDEFQAAREHHQGKVTVYIDPDDLSFATAVIPRDPEPYRLALQTTVFADLTVSEFLELMTQYRRENPELTTLYEDRIAKVRLERHEQLKKIGVERRLPRSYVNVGEACKKAKSLFASSRLVTTHVPIDTVAPGTLATAISGPGILPLGGASLIDHAPAETTSTPAIPAKTSKPKAEKPSLTPPVRLGRPAQKGELS